MPCDALPTPASNETVGSHDLPTAGVLQNTKPYLENYSEYMEVEEDGYNIMSGQVLLLEDQTGTIEVTLGRIIVQQTGIIGRCTYIVNATCAKWPDMELVVKINWAATSRTSEAEFMRRIREEVYKTGADWVLDHVPTILHSQDFPHLHDQVGGRISAFFDCLGKDHCASNPEDFEDEDRLIRVSVHEKLYDLGELDTVRIHAQVFLDVLQVHRWLYDYPRILHRDISLCNIMWHRRRGRICGVLNDFGLSSFRDSLSTATQRTGTLPFMPRDLHYRTVVSPRHLYRHDLESLFYVLLLLTGAHSLVKEPVVDSITKEKRYLLDDEKSPYSDWFSLNNDSILLEKHALLDSEDTPYTHPSFQVLNSRIKKALVSLTQGFIAARTDKVELRQAKPDVPRPHAPLTEDDFWSVPSTSEPAVPLPIVAFDDETLGGKWTYTGFLNCIAGGLAFERMYPLPRSD